MHPRVGIATLVSVIAGAAIAIGVPAVHAETKKGNRPKPKIEPKAEPKAEPVEPDEPKDEPQDDAAAIAPEPAAAEVQPDAKPDPKPDPVVKPGEPAVAVAEVVAVDQAGPKAGFAWEPFGYLRLQYRIIQNDPGLAFVGRDDGFELQNARIGARGKLGDRARFTVSFDGAIDDRSQVNTPEGRLRVGLRDAWAEFGLGGALAVRAGFFLPWVDPQSLIPDTSRMMVDRPLESRGIRATEGYQTPGLTPGRSLGAALRLDRPGSTGVGFELAIQNGADEFSSDNDNDKPAISAAFLARLPHDGFFLAAARYNPRTEGTLPALRDESDLQGSVGLNLVGGPVAFDIGAIFTRTSFDTTTAVASENAFGAHGQLMFVVPASLPFALGYRFAVIDPSSLFVSDRVMEHTAGMVITVPRFRMRVQAQLVHVVEQEARGLANSRIQLGTEVAL